MKNKAISLLTYSLFLILLPLIPSCFSCDKLLKQIHETEISGKIINITKENKTSINRVIILNSKNQLDTIEFCNSIVYDEFWNYIQIGDSLVKRSGSDSLILFNKIELKMFEYPCCDW